MPKIPLSQRGAGLAPAGKGREINTSAVRFERTDPRYAAMPAQAIGGFSKGIEQIAVFAQKRQAAVEKAEIVRIEGEIAARLEEFKNSSENISEPEQLKEAHSAWDKEMTDWMDGRKMSGRMQRVVRPYFDATMLRQKASYVGLTEEGGGKYARLQIEQAKLPWLNEIQQGAMGNAKVDPISLKITMTAEERINNGMDELGKLDPAYVGAKGIERRATLIAGVQYDKLVSDVESTRAQFENGEISWQDAITKFGEINSAADGADIFSAQKRSLKDKSRGYGRRIQTSAESTAGRMAIDIVKGATEGDDVSGMIEENGAFIESVLGKGFVEATVKMNNSPRFHDLLDDDPTKVTARKQILKKVKASRAGLYTMLGESRGALRVRKDPMDVINAISSSSLPAEEQAVLMEYIISVNMPVNSDPFIKESSNIKAKKGLFETFLGAYTDAVITTGDEDLYEQVYPEWYKVLDYAKDNTPEDTQLFVEGMVKGVAASANEERSRQMYRGKLSGRQRDIYYGKQDATPKFDYDALFNEVGIGADL